MQPQALADTINHLQIIAGLILLAVLLLFFHRTGWLRDAFTFPPPPPSSLTGSHLLLILLVYMLINGTALLTFRSLGQSPAPANPAGISATQTAPANTQPAQATQTAPAAALATTRPANPLAAAATIAAPAVADIVLIATMLYIASRTFSGGLAGFGLRVNHLGRDLLWAIVGYLAFWPICVGIAEAVTWLLHVLAPTYHPPEHPVLTFLEDPSLSPIWRLLPWVLAGLVAPFFEEVFFRGLLLTWFRGAGRSNWLAIAFTGVAFGLIHQPQWQLVPALALLGIFLGYLYIRTGSLTLVVFFHMIFNLRTLALTALSGQSGP